MGNRADRMRHPGAVYKIRGGARPSVPFHSLSTFYRDEVRSATTRPGSGRGRRRSRRPAASDPASRDFIPLNQPRVIETFTWSRAISWLI